MSTEHATARPTGTRERSNRTERIAPLATILNPSSQPVPAVPPTAETSTTHAGTNLRTLQDKRLDTVRTLIASQLPTVKGIILALSVKMIEATSHIRDFESRLDKWHEAPITDPYIPKSGRVKCFLTHSKSLKDDNITQQLKREQEETINLFGLNVSATFKQMAQREVEHAREKKTKIFAELSVALFDKVTFNMIKNQCIATSEQYKDDYKQLGIVILLDFLKRYIKDCVYSHYLESRSKTYLAVCKEYFENVRDHDAQLMTPNPPLTPAETNIRRHVQTAIIPFFTKVTYDLQMDLDEALELKEHEAKLAAYDKKNKIKAATSATQRALDEQTALAGHPSLAENMDELIEQKVAARVESELEDRVSKKVNTLMKSWGRKKSSGGRQQPPAKPNGKKPSGPGPNNPSKRNQQANGKDKPAKSTKPKGKPAGNGKRPPHKPKGRNGNVNPGGKRNGDSDGNNGSKKRQKQKR